MSKIEILIDPTNPAQSELTEGLRKSLNALETAKVEEKREKTATGTLSPGLDHVVSFVINHPDKAASLTAGILNLINNLLRFRSNKPKEGEKEAKPVIIVVNGERLSLPASDAAQKKFVNQIETSNQPSNSKTPKKKPRKKRARAVKRK